MMEHTSQDGTVKQVYLRDRSVKIGSGVTPLGGEKCYVENGIPLIRSQNVLWGRLDLGGVAHIPQEIHLNMNASQVKPLDVLLNITGASIGRSCVVPITITEANVNQHVCIIRCDASLNPFFLSAFLNSWYGQKQIWESQSCGNRQGLNYEQIGEIRLPCLERKDQDFVADVVNSLEVVSEIVEALLTKNMERKRGLMQELLTGQKRFKKFKGKFWRTVRIGSLLEERDRYVTWSDGAAYRFASIRRRSAGLFDRGTFYGREVKTKVLKLLKAGDFVISKRQVVHGAWAMVTKPFEGFGVSDEYDVLVNCDPMTLDIRFFNYLSQTRRLWHMAYLASNGVHIEKLIFDFDDFAKEKVRIPPTVEEQAMIVDILSTCDREIELLRKQLDALKEQKRGLMQMLLTGELRGKG